MSHVPRGCLIRLQKEYKAIQRDPPPSIVSAPRNDNILEWHYVLYGDAFKNTPFEGGYYHGKLHFPKEYPYKPPSITMCTPNGRFKIDTRLCLSISDFHPETWNPMWNVSTILTGLLSFMLEENITYGSISSSDKTKQQYAKQSMEFNKRSKIFREMFPGMITRYDQEEKEKRMQSQHKRKSSRTGEDQTIKNDDESEERWTKLFTNFLIILVFALAFYWAVS
eukprot:gb/GECH01000042.1/.p1 GENE.gb/GECH01000042.1/~~gb/GECH01000042.1/.p1  ORF type:complete len:223 (+),score=38.33 gb/GECH01000042.1/:1-669(+)